MHNVGNRFLFNFAVSYSGGGFKRLYEYARWFNSNGGAWFVIHPLCASLLAKFQKNHYFVVKQSRIERLQDDCRYLTAIAAAVGRPELYYAYGIPIYRRFGNINWFHLSNVLPLANQGIPTSLFDKCRLGILGRRIVSGLKNADVISGESNCSLELLNGHGTTHPFLSVNGSDDELEYIRTKAAGIKESIATVVGTNAHKALGDSFQVFEMLRSNDAELKLVIIGAEKDVPMALRRDRSVIVRGSIPRTDVMSCLRESRYYISTTLIENSYNAASEGIFIADQSYISDIGPHRELLMNEHFDEISGLVSGRPLLHVTRTDLLGSNLKRWNTVIVEMIEKTREVGRTLACGGEHDGRRPSNESEQR